jgi:hypothetical protein
MDAIYLGAAVPDSDVALGALRSSTSHRRTQTLLDRAWQAVGLVRHWLPERELVVAGDSTYAALEQLDSVRHIVCVIARLRLDAALYEPVPPRQPR